MLVRSEFSPTQVSTVRVNFRQRNGGYVYFNALPILNLCGNQVGLKEPTRFGFKQKAKFNTSDSNILTWFLGFQDKLLYLASFCAQVSFGIKRQEIFKKLQF